MRRVGPLVVTRGLLAVIAAVPLAAAACGSAPGQAPASPASSVAARPATAGPAPGSRALAEAVARRLLASVVLPPGARAVRRVPAQLRKPAEVPGSRHLVQRHEIRSVSRSARWVLGFLRRHVPIRLTGSGTGYTGLLARPVAFLMWSQRHPRRGLYQAGLVVGVLAARSGRTVIRADAQVIWYPPRSSAEYIRPGRFAAVRLREYLYNQRPHTVRLVSTSHAVIARLARTLNVLHADPGLTYGCPAILAEYRITFVPAAIGQAPIVAVPDGCNSVDIRAGGRAQPTLTGGQATITLMDRLLGLAKAKVPAGRS